MAFIDQYVSSLNSSNLKDDDEHFAAEALAAAALADSSGAGFGALLARVKFADGTQSKLFESGTANLAALLRIWTACVFQKGRERKWVKENTAWDVDAAYKLYQRVAERSLALWLNSHCVDCSGTGVAKNHCACKVCKGSGKASLPIGGFERERVLDMVAELENLLISHNCRAAGRMRRT